ncbi:hypothetical protein OROMI_023426 [Orobanche minor]
MENNSNNYYIVSNLQSGRMDVASTPTATGGPYPPGYRFMPTDKELIIGYLWKKVKNESIPVAEMSEVNLYRFTPNYLTENYPPVGNKEWYFFTPTDRRHPNGNRPKRSVEGIGWWKATGGDKLIKSNGKIIGKKKVLVFYFGKNKSDEEKTNWIMYEYRLDTPSPRPSSNNMRLDDWVLCRIYERNKKGKDFDDDRVPDHVGNNLLMPQPNYEDNNNMEDVQNNDINVADDQNHNHYDQGPMMSMVADGYGENIHQVPANYNYSDGINQVLPSFISGSGDEFVFGTQNNFDDGMPDDHQQQYFFNEEEAPRQGDFQPGAWLRDYEQELRSLL